MRRRLWQLAGFFVLVLSIAALRLAYTPLYDYHERYYHDHAKYKQSASNGFAFIARVIEAHHDLWIVLETLALVAFTGTLWWSTRQLWRTSITHADHMEASAAEAGRAATAAFTQAQIMKAAFAARIVIVRPQSSAVFDHDSGFIGMRFSVVIANRGQSRTENLKMALEGKMLLIEDNEKFVYGYPQDSSEHSTVIDGQSEINTSEIPIAPTSIFPVIRRDADLFIYGWIEYDDIFPDTKRHRREYCFRVRIGNDFATTFFTYGQHNRDYDIERPSPML